MSELPTTILAHLRTSVLRIAGDAGVGDELSTVQTGDGTPGPLEVSTNAVRVNGELILPFGDATRFTNGQGGILVPFYKYPNDPYSDATVTRLLNLIRMYRGVPVIIIINPSNGPGTVWDGNYAAFIKMAQSAGARVIGYVSTDYAARSDADVKADIDAWGRIYADTPVEGIFLDEQPWDTGPSNTGDDYIQLYKRYTDYCHGHGYYPVVANPGTNQQWQWFATRTADIIVVHENLVYPNDADMEGKFPNGHSNFKYTLRAALVYDQPVIDILKLRHLRKYVQWVYITDDRYSDYGAGPVVNPWDTLPTHFEQLFAALNDATVPGQGFTYLTASTASTAWDAEATKAVYITMAANSTLATPTNLIPGNEYTVVVKNGASAYTLAWSIFYTGSTTIAATANRTTVVKFFYDGFTMKQLSADTYVD